MTKIERQKKQALIRYPIADYPYACKNCNTLYTGQNLKDLEFCPICGRTVKYHIEKR